MTPRRDREHSVNGIEVDSTTRLVVVDAAIFEIAGSCCVFLWETLLLVFTRTLFRKSIQVLVDTGVPKAETYRLGKCWNRPRYRAKGSNPLQWGRYRVRLRRELMAMLRLYLSEQTSLAVGLHFCRTVAWVGALVFLGLAVHAVTALVHVENMFFQIGFWMAGIYGMKRIEHEITSRIDRSIATGSTILKLYAQLAYHLCALARERILERTRSIETKVRARKLLTDIVVIKALQQINEKGLRHTQMHRELSSAMSLCKTADDIVAFAVEWTEADSRAAPESWPVL